MNAGSFGVINDIMLGVWVLISLVGTLLGLAIAKYSQAWAQDALHPGVAVGALIVIDSVALTLLAGTRYEIRRLDLLDRRRPSRLLMVLSVSLIVGLGWAALAIICFAGWEVPHPSAATPEG